MCRFGCDHSSNLWRGASCSGNPGSLLAVTEAQTVNRGVAQSINIMTRSLSNIMKLPTVSLMENLGLLPVFLLGAMASFVFTVPIRRKTSELCSIEGLFDVTLRARMVGRKLDLVYRVYSQKCKV